MLVNYETAKNRAVNEQPAHVRLMKKLAIADYEPASDAGNIRYYPKGRLMKSLIEQYVTRRVMEYGGIEVETPIMYDTKHPSLQSYLNRFPCKAVQHHFRQQTAVPALCCMLWPVSDGQGLQYIVQASALEIIRIDKILI